MAQFKQLITFDGQDGLDSDTDYRYMRPGDSRYRLCCRSNNNIGSIKDFKGNTLVSFTLPAAPNKCIGYCEDIENDAIIYFIWNGNNANNEDGDHSILRYYTRTRQIEKILYAEGILSFRFQYKITSANVIGDMLYWTDNYNPPRKINLIKAYNYTNGIVTTEKYSIINEQVIDAIKYPPLGAPIVSYDTDENFPYNNVEGKLWQFQYKNFYDDKEESVASPISKIALPQGEEGTTGLDTATQYTNNVINITVLTGHETVTKIKIYAREGNNGSWFLIDIIEKYKEDGTRLIDDNIAYVFNFYNNKIKSVVDQTNQIRPFDYVPQLAGAQESIDNQSRIVYGDYIEGYDNVDINIDIGFNGALKDISPALTYMTVERGPEIDENYWDPRLFPSAFCGVGRYKRKYNDWLIYIPTAISVGSTYTITVTAFDGTVWLGTTVANAADTSTTILARLYNGLVTSGMPETETDNNGSTIQVAENRGTFIRIVEHYIIKKRNSDCYVYNRHLAKTIVATIQTTAENQRYKTFKKFAYHNFGIVYYDRAGRHGAVNDSDSDCTVYNSITRPDYQCYLSWNIYHQPPEWADSYQWVYTKNTSIQSWQQYYMVYADIINDPTTAKFTILPISTPITNYSNAVKKLLTFTPYSFVEGDRVKIYAAYSDAGDVYMFSNPIDKKIVEQDLSGDILVEKFDFASLNPNPAVYKYYLYEIYTPRKGLGEKIYYEIGERFGIGNPGESDRYHMGPGNNQDIASSTPAKGTIEGGDAYLLLRYGTTVSVPVESEHFSDFYESDDYDIGRPNTVIPDMRRLRLQSLRHSNNYIENTQINGLSTFEANNYKTLPDRYGTIVKLVEVGYVLKVFQKSKVTSVYIKRASTAEADGTNNLFISEDVIGTERPPEEDYGTEHPESVVKHNRHIYFYDINKGVVVRDASNGMFAISKYKMITEFKEVSKSLRESGRVINAYGIFDEENGEYILTLTKEASVVSVDYYRLYDQIISYHFHEDSNRWKTYMPYYKSAGVIGGSTRYIAPDFFGMGKDTLISFMDGSLYLHNDNSTRNNFFGIQYKCIIEPVCNADPTKIKVFDAVEINSNKKWSAPTKGNITVPPCDMFPEGMTSRLSLAQFEGIEGKYYAAFLNNMDTPGLTDEQGLIDGEELRGQVLILRIENSDTEETVLFSVVFMVTPSELS